MTALLPGVISSVRDTGGVVGSGNLPTVSIHGSRSNDQRMLLDGLSIQSMESSGNSSAYVPNISSSQEVTIDTSATSAEASQGGVRLSAIRKKGGNRYSGTFFGTGTNGTFEASNYTQRLQARVEVP